MMTAVTCLEVDLLDCQQQKRLRINICIYIHTYIYLYLFSYAPFSCFCLYLAFVPNEIIHAFIIYMLSYVYIQSCLN